MADSGSSILAEASAISRSQEELVPAEGTQSPVAAPTVNVAPTFIASTVPSSSVFPQQVPITTDNAPLPADAPVSRVATPTVTPALLATTNTLPTIVALTTDASLLAQPNPPPTVVAPTNDRQAYVANPSSIGFSSYYRNSIPLANVATSYLNTVSNSTAGRQSSGSSEGSVLAALPQLPIVYVEQSPSPSTQSMPTYRPASPPPIALSPYEVIPRPTPICPPPVHNLPIITYEDVRKLVENAPDLAYLVSQNRSQMAKLAQDGQIELISSIVYFILEGELSNYGVKVDRLCDRFAAQVMRADSYNRTGLLPLLGFMLGGLLGVSAIFLISRIK